MSEYLYAVQRKTGHEVVSAVIDPNSVKDVSARRYKNGKVAIFNGNSEVISSEDAFEEDEELTLYRWPADDKLAEPVSAEVEGPSES